MAEAKIHMDKFGISYSVFDPSMIEGAPEYRPNDIQAMDYFAHAPLIGGNGSSTTQYFPYAELSTTADWTGIKYFFKEDPNECMFKAYIPLLHTYHADNNPYGGILDYRISETTAGYLGALHTYYSDADDWTKLIYTANVGKSIIVLYNTLYRQTNTLNITVTGTHAGGDNDITIWPLARANNYKYGTGLTKTIIEGILKMTLAQNMYGSVGGGKSARRQRSKRD
jgi:hypothetical protein